MSTALQKPLPPSETEAIPPLESGDHLEQPTFHERYEQMPAGFRAELIAGVVYVASPTTPKHGKAHNLLNVWIGTYHASTPGTEAFDGTTVLLAKDSEPEPDGLLTIVGGGTHEDDEGYLVGQPEFTAEIASSTASYDLHSKRRDYEKHGVQEYLIAVVRQKRIVWLVRENDRYVELAPGDDGIYRSRVMPGLWLDPQAFLANDYARVLDVLQNGIASPEHAAFVADLARRSQKSQA